MSDLRCEYCRRNQPVKAVENDFCEHTGLTYEELVSQLSAYKEALEFYANMKNYEITIPNNIISDERVVSITSVVDKSQFGCMILRDEGMKAQRALTPVQSPKSGEIK